MNQTQESNPMYKYEIYQNQKDGLWQWRIADEDGREIARSRIAHAHPGDCHIEIIRVNKIDPNGSIKTIMKEERPSYVAKRRRSRVTRSKSSA